MKNRKSEKQGQSLYRKMGMVFALFVVLAGAELIQKSMNPVLKQGNVLERNVYGDGSYDAELIWEIPEKELEQELSVHVAEQGLTKEEQQALLAAAEQEIAALEKQRKALQGNVKLLKAVEKVKPDLDAIQPEKTLTGAVKGVTVEQVKELKAAVIRGAAAEQKVRELKVENQQLQQKIPSTKEKLKEAQERQRLENENRQLKVQVEYLEEDLSRERGFSARLREGIGAVLDFLDRHLPEQFRPLVEKARELLPVPEVQQPERDQERGHTWGGMEL
jgi:hypothetical protein